MRIQVEYLWIDGTKPTQKLRSKTRVLDGPIESVDDVPVWGFDGSSTEQAVGKDSDCVLRPVYMIADPVRGGDNVIALCEVWLPEGEPHPTNTRRRTVEMAERYADYEMWFGIEQEYTFFKDGRPLGWPVGGYPAPQGGYYCGVGADEIWGRDVVEAHARACLEAGIAISGTNAEVMMGQWEFQIGPVGPIEVADQIWMARWLLYRIAEDFDVSATLDPKPIKGDWNGAGAHTNFSTKQMRESYDECVAAAEALGKRHDLHIANYGTGIDERLTGLHETSPWTEYSYGVSNRGCSVRIPWQVAQDGKGYIEDRRPNANMDPYVVTALITETVCGTFAGDI